MMVKLCLMASHGYNPGTGLLLPQEPDGVLKDYPCLRFRGGKEEMRRPNFLNLRPHQCDDRWNPAIGLANSSAITNVDSTITRPVLIDVKDTCTDPVLFSSTIAEHCTPREKILQLLESGSSELQRGGLDLSLLSGLMELEHFPFDAHQEPITPVAYPIGDFDTEKPWVDFIGDMALGSRIIIDRGGRIIFADNCAEIKHILAVAAEFYLDKKSDNWKRKSTLIPHFSWHGFLGLCCELRYLKLNASNMQAGMASSLRVIDAVAGPSKSGEKTKLKTRLKKRNSKKQEGRESDICRRTYLHACEDLLSLMMDRTQHGRIAILSEKHVGPGLADLLTWLTNGIAGTGLAVLFGVVCKIACGRVQFSSSKLFNTGLGVGLVWLSCAVNGLRDTIIYVSKKAAEIDMNDEEKPNAVDRSLKEVYVRAASVIVVALLMLAY